MTPGRPLSPHANISWWGWGDPAQIPALAPELRGLLADGLVPADGLGIPGGKDLPEPSLTDVHLSPSRIPDEAARERGGAT